MPEVILTTTNGVPGREIDMILDVIEESASTSLSVVADFFNSIVDLTGGSLSAFETPVSTMFEDVRRKLRAKAVSIGADAVVGLDFEVTEFSKSGALVVVGVGTAVALKAPGAAP